MAGVETSKARQLYLLLRDRIASGRLEDDGHLPGEQALAAGHGVSRVTVRRALAELEREGFVSRRRGAGTFVSRRHSREADHRRYFRRARQPVSDGPRDRRAPDRIRLSRAAAGGRRRALRLKAGRARPQYSVRVRLIDGQPFSYLVTHVPERFGITYSEADLASRPLLALLERSGIKVERATQEVTATLASPEVAGALGVEVGSALIGLTRTVFERGGGGVEHSSALYRPDRYTLRMEMERKVSAGVRRWTAVLPKPANEERPAKQAS